MPGKNIVNMPGFKEFLQGSFQQRCVEQSFENPVDETRSKILEESAGFWKCWSGAFCERTGEYSGVFVATKFSGGDRVLQCTKELTTRVPMPLVLHMMKQLVFVPLFSFQVQTMEQLVVVPVLSVSRQGPAMGCRAIVGWQISWISPVQCFRGA